MPQKRPRPVRILRVRWRRLLRHLERISPLLLAWLPSWGTSLLLHGLAILPLALSFSLRSAAGPRGGNGPLREGGRGWAGLDGAAPALRRRLEPELSRPVPGQRLPRAGLHGVGHRGDRAGAVAPAGGRTPPHPEEPLSAQRPQGARMARRSPAALRRPLRRRRADGLPLQPCHRHHGALRSLWDLG